MLIETSDQLRQWIKPGVTVSPLKDFGIIISYSGKIVSNFVESLVPLRAIDPTSQSHLLLKAILEKIFDLEEFVIGVKIFQSLESDPLLYSRFVLEIGKEIVKKRSKHHKNLFFKVSSSEVCMSKEMLSYLYEEFSNMKEPYYPNKEKQARYFKMEIDAVINVDNKYFGAIESKMFTCPLEDEGRVLKRLLSPSRVKYYIGERKSFYFLMGFSFFYDENRMVSPEDEIDSNPSSSSDHRKDKDLHKHLPVPFSFDEVDLGEDYSSWIFHLCILDKRILSLMETEGRMFSGKVTNLILSRIKEHQKSYLAKILSIIEKRIEEGLSLRKNSQDTPFRVFLEPYSQLKLNICLNYNILKVHYMSGYIAELKTIIKQKDYLLQQKEKALEQERKARLEERKARLEERKARLELELRFLVKDAEKRQEKSYELSEIEMNIKKLDEEIEKIKEKISLH